MNSPDRSNLAPRRAQMSSSSRVKTTNAISQKIALGLLLAVGAVGGVFASKTEASSTELFKNYPSDPAPDDLFEKAKNECGNKGSIRFINKIPTCIPIENTVPKIPLPHSTRPKTDFELLNPVRAYERKFEGTVRI